MDLFCKNCGVKLKENEKFCPNCGEKVVKPENTIFNRFKIPLLIVIVVLVIGISAFLLTNHTQTVEVDTVRFEIPEDYVNEPLRTDVSYDQNVKSSAMGWSNDENYIEIGITRSPGSGINSQKVAAEIGGTPTKMFGYTGYYQKHDNEGYSFVFGMKDKVCMIYVSDYDAFNDIKVLE